MMRYCTNVNNKGYTIQDMITGNYSLMSECDLWRLVNSNKELPRNLQIMNNGKIKIIKVPVVKFHNPNEINGYLSNWAESPFNCNGINFTSGEQYMMFSKAMLFSDTDIAKKILEVQGTSSYSMGKIKDLGRQVRNFNESVWCANRENIMYTGLREKFLQNEQMRYNLISTGNVLIAECAVKDRIWGIGLSMNDNDVKDVTKWNGKNLLGITLMRIRDSIK